MRKTCLLPLLLAASCGSTNNVILNPLGGVVPGQTSAGVAFPSLLFTGVSSSFGSEIALFDADGRPTGDRAWVVIMSDRPGLCDILKKNRTYFRTAVEAFQAMILIFPKGRLGTFVPGRQGDEGTFSEIIAAAGPQPATAPFSVISTTFFTFESLTDWENGAATGNFDLIYLAPDNAASYEYQGQYQAVACDGLDGVLLP